MPCAYKVCTWNLCFHFDAWLSCQAKPVLRWPVLRQFSRNMWISTKRIFSPHRNWSEWGALSLLLTASTTGKKMFGCNLYWFPASSWQSLANCFCLFREPPRSRRCWSFMAVPAQFNKNSLPFRILLTAISLHSFHMSYGTGVDHPRFVVPRSTKSSEEINTKDAVVSFLLWVGSHRSTCFNKLQGWPAEVTLKFELAALIQKKIFQSFGSWVLLEVVEVPVYQMRPDSFRVNPTCNRGLSTRRSRLSGQYICMSTPPSLCAYKCIVIVRMHEKFYEPIFFFSVRNH